MADNKTARKSPRTVRMPAMKLAHLRKRMAQRRYSGKKQFPPGK